MNKNILLHRIAAAFMIVMMLFAAMPARPAGAVSLNIASVASGTWEATAWPSTQRSGTITVTAGNTNVVGTGTAFLTELSVGNIIKTTGNIQIGTVASITSDTALTLTNIPATTRTNIAYNAQGVGPADNVTIAAGHTVTIAAKPVHQTGSVTVSAGGTLTVSNSGTVLSTLSVNGTVNGTAGGALGALTVNNGGVVNADGTSGAYTASSVTVSSGGTVNITRNFTVNGATSVTGTLNFSSNSVTARAMLFNGAVTLNNGAVWSESTGGNGANNTYTFQHNFTNNAATFTASPTSTHTFSGTSRTLGGSALTSIARVVVNGTYTNNSTLTVGTNLSGTGALTNSASGTLNVGGTVSISTLANAGTATKTGAGPITTALANFTNTGTLILNGTGTIQGITNNAAGIVNLNSSGLIYAFDNATATSTLNISALSVPHFHSLIVSTPGNTVNYSGAGDQTVKPITYSNLTFSGSGSKSITMPNSFTLANGILSIAPTGTAKAAVIGPNLSVNHLNLAGVGKAPGTWGSSASAAANQDDNFFALTTGYLNVTNDSRLSQSITFTSAPPDNATVGGPTYTPTATASSGLDVEFTIDPAAASVCEINAGVVSFIGTGTCEIDANQAGDATYLATTQQQSFDVKSGQTISFTSTAPVGAVAGEGTYTPTATATSSLPVEFTIDPSAASVCSISAGVVSFDAQGTCVINANQPGDGDYHPAPQVQQSFVINGPVYWLPWYNNVNLDTQLRIGNVSNSTATVRIFIGGNEVTSGGGITLLAGESTRVSYPSVDDGPVKIVSDAAIVAAERVIYKIGGVPVSFSEMMALSDTDISTTYWLPWYNNVNLDTQLRIGNVSNSTATVHIFIGGNEVTPASGIPLQEGESTRVSYPSVDDGPVQIVSNVNIVAAERVIYTIRGKQTSFSEMMGLPDQQLDTTYWLPWYNNVNLDTQLRIGNVSNSTATVHVFIGGNEVTPASGIPLLEGESTRLSYASVDDGPIRIVSDVPVVAAERVIYTIDGVQTSFSEMMGLPDSELNTIYWLPWYNNVSATGLDTQLRIGNVSNSTATVHIFIGGVEVTPAAGITLLTGASTRVSYTGVNNGPVKIVSDVPIVAAERVIYKISGKPISFSEMR